MNWHTNRKIFAKKHEKSIFLYYNIYKSVFGKKKERKIVCMESLNYDFSLIQEVKSDIKTFGGDLFVAVWCKNLSDGKVFYRNYAIITEKKPIKPDEVPKDQYITMMSLSALLIILEKQNAELKK